MFDLDDKKKTCVPLLQEVAKSKSIRLEIAREVISSLVCYLRLSLAELLHFTFMHLADAFIQSNLQLHSGYTFSLVCVFPGNRTHNLLRSRRNALPLSHTGTALKYF